MEIMVFLEGVGEKGEAGDKGGECHDVSPAENLCGCAEGERCVDLGGLRG